MLQAERGQLCARGLVIRVTDAANPQTFRDLDEHRLVVDIDDLLGWHLGDVQRKPKDVRVGFAEVDKAGGNKEVYELIQLECLNPMRIQFAGFVVDHGDPQFVLRLEIADQLDHLRIRLRLREHEFPELIPCERSLLVENRPAQVFLQREFAHFVGIKGQVMPVFHLLQIQIERLRSQCPGLMAPSVGKQHATDIQKQRRNRDRSFHLTSIIVISHFECLFVRRRRAGSMAQMVIVWIFPKRFLAHRKQILWRFARSVDGQMPASTRQYEGASLNRLLRPRH